MAKRTGRLLIAAGCALLLAATLLFFYNSREARRAELASQAALDGLHAALAEQTPPPPPTASKSSGEDGLLTVNVDGYDYIGSLSIPSVGLELPVMAEWDEARLKKAPCRQFGSPAGDDLVIAGHNYRGVFGSLGLVELDSPVSFTDAAGQTVDYQVTAIETVVPTAVDRVQNSGHDLVLYTCTIGGSARTVLFCDRAEN